MKKGRTCRKCMTWMALVGMGGASFQLSNCDQTVRTTILAGLSSATDALLSSLTTALFMSLENSANDDVTVGDFGSSSN